MRGVGSFVKAHVDESIHPAQRAKLFIASQATFKKRGYVSKLFLDEVVMMI